MQYRTLGGTGLRVSALSFGGSSLGGVFRPVTENQAVQTVRTAIDLGINFIDTSPFYGITLAETMLGKALRGIPRDKYYLAAKVGRYGPAEFDFSANRVTRSVDESLARLGVDCIDVIQCHDIEFGSIEQVVEETIPALARLREQGKVRFIGITGYPLRIFPAVMDRISIDTIISYCHFNLNDSTLAWLLPYFREKRTGVIHAAPLGMGLLTARGAPDWHPAPPAIKDACARAAAYCREQGVNISKLALQFSLANPEIHTVVVGTADPAEIEENVRWASEPADADCWLAYSRSWSQFRVRLGLPHRMTVSGRMWDRPPGGLSAGASRQAGASLMPLRGGLAGKNRLPPGWLLVK